MILLFSIFGITCNILQILRHRKFQFYFNVILTVGLLLFVFSYFSDNSFVVSDLIVDFKRFTFFQNVTLIFFLLSTTVVNFSLETLRWQQLCSPIKKITFFDSLRSVFKGVAFGNLLSQGLGDYFGRVVSNQTSNRKMLSSAFLMGSIFQIAVSAFIGFIGVFSLSELFDFPVYFLQLIPVVIVLTSIVTIVFRTYIFSWLNRVLPSFSSFGLVFSEYTNNVLAKVFVLTILRYAVFIIQTSFLVLFLGDYVALYDLICLICVSFLVRTVIPRFNLIIDFGIRQYSLVYFLGYLNVESSLVVFIGVLIWFFNVLLPSVSGVFLLWKK